MIVRSQIIILLIFLSIQHSFAQEFSFSNLNTENGLSNNSVNCIFQDSKGFLWIGTFDGLNKFNGYDFETFKNIKDAHNSISNNDVTTICEDKEGNLWVGTRDGLNRYNSQKNNFTRIKVQANKEVLKDVNVDHLFIDSDNILWMATNTSGLYKLEKPDEISDNPDFVKYEHSPGDTTSISTNSIRYIAEAKNGDLWIGGRAADADLNKYIKKTDSFIRCRNHAETYFSNTIFTLLVDANDNLCVGTWGSGINVLEKDSKEFTHFVFDPDDKNSLSHNIATSIIEYPPENYIIGTRGGGINFFNTSDKKFTNYRANIANPFSISNDYTTAVFIDDAGVFWVGTLGNGIDFTNLKAKKFKKISKKANVKNTLNHNIVNGLIEDDRGNLIVATKGGGLNIIDSSRTVFSSITNQKDNSQSLSTNNINTLFVDKDGYLWIGTDGKGMCKTKLSNLYTKNKSNISFTNYTYTIESKNGLKNNYIYSFCQDKYGYIWLGSYGGGLHRYDPKNDSIINILTDPKHPENIANNAIISIIRDKHDDIWLTTRGLGIFRFTPKKEIITYSDFQIFQHIPNNSNSIASNEINSLFCSKDGKIWVGTYKGLSKIERLKNEKTYLITNYSSIDGLSNEYINGIVEDNEGNLWLSNSDFIEKFDIKENKIYSFNKIDRGKRNKFNDNSCLLDKKGIIYFGGNEGITLFDPDSIYFNEYIPNVVLTNLKIFNKTVEVGEKIGRKVILNKTLVETKTITLSYQESVFSIEFASLHFANPKLNQYAYKLEGFDSQNDKWTIVSANRNIATYTNLDPGEYTFMVKGSNSDGIWNDTPTKLKIIITPPLWKTWWFRSIIIVFIILLIIIAFRIKTKNIKIQSEILEAKVKKRTNQLNEVNTQLEEKNEEITQQKEEIQSINEELQQHQQNLEKAIDDRTSELSLAKKRAEESDKLKTAFLANMSHEIRTPMNAIVGFSQLLAEDDLDDNDKDEFISRIVTNSNSLLTLIDDILDLSMIEANKVLIESKEFELNKLINEVFSNGTLLSKNELINYKLSNNIETQNLIIKTDNYRIKQVLLNLFNNATKFTEKGFVELLCDLEDGMLKFKIIDTGIGISKENLEIIFDRFRKLSDNKNKLFRGTGLGLAISKKISQLLGGELTVESETGKGSVFTLSLPESIVIKKKEMTPKPETKKVYDWSDKEIMIVEDEEANYVYLKVVLAKTKAKVLWAQDGQEAIDMYNEHKHFDMILMDIKMPNVNGIDATEAIKKLNPNQLVIAQTAYARREDKFEIEKAGFDGYLVKPIKPNLVYPLLAKYLENS